MKLLALFRSGKARKKTAPREGHFIDAYQESLNRLGREQLSKIVNRGVEMPGMAL